MQLFLAKDLEKDYSELDVTPYSKFSNAESQSVGSSFVSSDYSFSSSSNTRVLNKDAELSSQFMLSVCTYVQHENQKINTDTTA